MDRRRINRRDFLRASVLAAAGLAAASCAQPAPQIIEKEVPVEKVVKETVLVQKEVAVEKVVTATPKVSKYSESPQLAGLVASAKLAPVDERLPDDPVVHTPVEEIGQYGGTWHRLSVGPGDLQLQPRLSYENMVRWNVNGSDIVPNIAKSWEISSDGKQFTFSLRKGMKWSDGEPFTAADILYLIDDVWGNKEMTPTKPASWTVGGELMKADAPDDYTIRFSCVAPSGLMMVLLPSADGGTFGRYPKHYMQQFHVKYADKAALDAAVKQAGVEFWYQLHGNMLNEQANVDKPVIYAWKLTVAPPKQPVVAERNAYYWKVDTEGNQLPYIDRIEWMLVNDAATVNLRAAQGEIDMQLRQITFNNLPIFEESKEKSDFRILKWDQRADAVMAPNLTNKDPVLREIVQDKRFRYALSLGMNREEIIEAVYLGMAEPRQVSPSSTSPLYLESQAKNMIEYDPDRANGYLDDMGLTQRDSDGYRLRTDGKRVSLTYEYIPEFASWGDIGELCSARWKQIGVELLLKEEARTLFYERKAANEVDICVWAASAEFNPLIDPRHFIPYSDESNHAIQYARWWNTGGKEGEEPTGDLRKVLELYDEIKVTPNWDKQVELFHEILQLNQENLWTIGISTAPPQLAIVKNNFRNVPEKANFDWHLLSPGATVPEQYFIKS